MATSLHTYADFTCQVGEPWVAECTKETYSTAQTLSDSRRVNRIFQEIQKRQPKWAFGDFLSFVFAHPNNSAPRSNIHRATISNFLKGKRGVTAQEIVDLWYDSADSRPKDVRTPRTSTIVPIRKDGTAMARAQLRQWALIKVMEMVEKEAEGVGSKAGGFHLSSGDTTWEFVQNFSLQSVARRLQDGCPTIVRLLTHTAHPHRSYTSNISLPEALSKQPAGSGSGKNRRNPAVATIFAAMLLLSMRNLQFSVLRKVVGIWLFSNLAADSIFSVLSRIGSSSSYTSVLKTLRTLSTSAKEDVWSKANLRGFLLIYDNINRMRRAWDPESGQHDLVQSGTAATFVELDECDPTKAFDPRVLKDAMDKGEREWKKNVDANE